MKKVETTIIVVDLEDLDSLENGVCYWIEQNERTLLDDMNNSDRDERLDQLNYHGKLHLLLQKVLDAKQELWHAKLQNEEIRLK